jgi:hypothetical protein
MKSAKEYDLVNSVLPIQYFHRYRIDYPYKVSTCDDSAIRDIQFTHVQCSEVQL